jgi:threonine/homoserine/homoserine lactone efflux protein
LVPAASLWAFALAAFALIVIPGPSVLFVIGRIYLGVQAVRHRNDHTESSPAAKMRPSSLRLLREGFIVGATNPKTMVFFVAVLPQFVDYAHGAIPLQMGAPGMVFFTIALTGNKA